ncbi:MAG: UDP-N-acetylmuramate-L-alanine ligase [Candidatus Moranbacteria bacterium GW2011_GWC2_37_73]|nr:MAG: UDP-N-acetylmuramate-L-alanine ligase [Parcubacteria group bacterium GW2011_GWC1_36_108]KKQ00833.1 MAG: UDP-N-acetylmuramate-L-alanine ligase [Candidatus Moranbacteria bacterium GW2011_GWD2_36_198]KKQ00867.1 MAG: UDP-N-acetylmuramate-L-alanine ligase [Candidatus Moranbacteria bacterium GW2011_GWD1_36_198]KKQ39973.1 MAG: UDP-N-acetylmuramate-L-alanine ligase [Candidatus Moranbacteria bacterium GW2011_GWC2_37_73]HAS00077.1 UDP-N-acetylmuramate--L-alanine ligase [Candidatus Moranbacteria b
MNIKDIKKAYFVGIKGAGMTAVAQILQSRNIEISGSDTGEVFYTDAILKRLNIPYYEEFIARHVPNDATVVIYSTAYNEGNNVEMAEAKKMGVLMLSYPEILGLLFAEKLGIAVCGTHGKTTTSAMLASALTEAELEPSAIVGSNVISWEGSALSGNGEYFVAEADEYQNKLRFYQPWSVILTSVDWDHPDFFPDFVEYKKVFKEFVKKIPKTGFLVVWGDSSDTLEVAESANCNLITYGFGEDNEYRITNYKLQIINENTMQFFEVEYDGKNLGEFISPLSGKHNILNAASVIALSHKMGLDLSKIGKSLNEFKGTTRRFEYIGKYKQALLIDDYAHHPDEIKATLAGAKDRFEGKKIWTVFHPHTFSRTKALLQDFAQSFDNTERVIVIDTYGSARESGGEATSEDLVTLINKYNYNKAEYIPTIDEATQYLKEKSGEYDVLITMGAGDVWRVGQALKE